MIKFIYGNYHAKGGFFTSFYLDDCPMDQIADKFKQGLFSLDPKAIDIIKEHHLYCLGTFDNVSGEIVSGKEFILDFASLLTELKLIEGD